MEEEKKQKKPGTFSKGDPRINRKGRPKTFDALRSLAQDIAHEIGIKKDGSAVVSPIDGKPMTVVQAILMQWAMSPDFNKQKAFIELSYGKVPDEVETKGEVTVKVVYQGDNEGNND